MDKYNVDLTTLLEQQINPTAAEHPAAAMLSVYSNKKQQTGSGEQNNIPLTPMMIPSLLTRAKLSPETRALEEKRLAKMERKRQLLRKGQKRSRGQFHWKRKEKNKKRENRKKYEKESGFGAIINGYGAKRIDPVLWVKYIGQTFKDYDTACLLIKKIKRPPGFGRDDYYGNKEFPLTVYSFRVWHTELGCVWDGEEQRKKDGVEVLRIPQPPKEEAKEKPAD